MRESFIEAFLLNRIKSLGGLCLKQEWIGTRGAPDRLVILPGGEIVMVELKATGAKPEPHQLRMHERLRALGVRVEVVDSVELVEGLFK
jgi:hypothetical protein